jgi:hypothetical protein
MFSPIKPKNGTADFAKYEAEGCGICEKFGAEVFWPSSRSHYAHADCYREIRKIEADLVAKIDELFANSIDKIQAHICATEAVRKALNGFSLQAYLNKYGAKKLKLTFDSFGVIAIQMPLAKL